MVGLYDGDGVLRFVGGDIEACEAYARLFELSLSNCSLQPMPYPAVPAFRKKRRSRPQEARSS